MVTDNGIAWLQVWYELWPAVCWAAGSMAGWGLHKHYSSQLLRAQRRQIHNLTALNAKLADDNERMVEYMNYVRKNVKSD